MILISLPVLPEASILPKFISWLAFSIIAPPFSTVPPLEDEYDFRSFTYMLPPDVRIISPPFLTLLSTEEE
jgi:hypothetical protein